MTLRVVVVDDEHLARQFVSALVERHESLELVGQAADGAQALDLIVEQRPDLVFLDIQMPELDGFQVVAALESEVLPAIIFVTAYDAYAIRAFEVNAIDYLLKPVTPDRFSASIERVRTRLAHKTELLDEPIRQVASHAVQQQGLATRFVARRGAKHYFVRIADIDWIEADGNYVRLRTGPTSHLVRETMKGVEAKLDSSQFVRIHRSTIVAIDRIRSVEAREQGEYLVTMSQGSQLVSSRGYSEQVRNLLR